MSEKFSVEDLKRILDKPGAELSEDDKAELIEAIMTLSDGESEKLLREGLSLISNEGQGKLLKFLLELNSSFGGTLVAVVDLRAPRSERLDGPKGYDDFVRRFVACFNSPPDVDKMLLPGERASQAYERGAFCPYCDAYITCANGPALRARKLVS